MMPLPFWITCETFSCADCKAVRAVETDPRDELTFCTEEMSFSQPPTRPTTYEYVWLADDISRLSSEMFFSLLAMSPSRPLFTTWVARLAISKGMTPTVFTASAAKVVAKPMLPCIFPSGPAVRLTSSCRRTAFAATSDFFSLESLLI